MSNGNTLCNSHDSVLVVIDIQQRLASVMPEKILKRIIASTQFLIQSAELLNIPVIVTEQYPKGLGTTVSDLELTNNSQVIEKTCFACTANDDFQNSLKDLDKKQIILAGMEAHICVTQTAVDLINEGYQVFIASDAVCSRKKILFKNAIQRLQHAGAIITNSESIAFEWLRDAKHKQFKAISKLIK